MFSKWGHYLCPPHTNIHVFAGKGAAPSGSDTLNMTLHLCLAKDRGAKNRIKQK